MMIKLYASCNNRRRWAGGLLAILLVAAGCDNYKFMKSFGPLLDQSLAIDRQYEDFEGSLPNNKHWQENMQILKGMTDAKGELLEKLKSVRPNPENETLYQALVEDLNHSIAYLNLEKDHFHKKTEFAMWAASSYTEGLGGGSAKPRKEFVTAKETVLALQDAMTAGAEKANASQERLSKILLEKTIRPNQHPIKYARFLKGYVDGRARN